MGEVLEIMQNVRVARDPIFIPAANGDQRHNHCILTVINNRGTKDAAGQARTDSYTLHFWGKYAEVAAWSLGKGREINVRGENRSYLHDTGRVKENGRKEVYRRNEVLVRKFFFGGDSKKELMARLAKNIAALEVAGGFKLPASVTPETLLAITKTPRVDYNPAIHDATGKYGVATIWRKGQAPVATASAPVDMNDVTAMKARIKEIEDAATAGGTVDAFPTA
jgi:hypothetical protein